MSLEEFTLYESEIQRYLHHQLSQNERFLFEQKLAKNSALAEEVRFRQQIQFTIQHKDKIAFKQKLDQAIDSTTISIENLNKSSPQSIIQKWGYGLLLGIILTSTVFFLWQTFNTPSATISDTLQTQIIKQYLSPYENIINTNSDRFGIIQDAFQAYEKADYPTTILNLEAATKNRKDEVLEFYLAISYLHNDQAILALPILTNLEQLQDPILHDAILWYKALVHIQLKEKSNAILLLQQLTRSIAYQQQASDCLLLLQ